MVRPLDPSFLGMDGLQLIKRYGLTLAKVIHGVETFLENKLHVYKS